MLGNITWSLCLRYSLEACARRRAYCGECRARPRPFHPSGHVIRVTRLTSIWASHHLLISGHMSDACRRRRVYPFWQLARHSMNLGTLFECEKLLEHKTVLHMPLSLLSGDEIPGALAGNVLTSEPHTEPHTIFGPHSFHRHNGSIAYCCRYVLQL